MVVTASAPAKIILFGEHFVVYGEPAIATAVDLRVVVSAELRKDKRIYISSKKLEASGLFFNGHFQVVTGGHEARTKLEPIRTAIQSVLDLSKSQCGVSVWIKSSIPVAAGLGSSAAVATATIAAIGKLLSVKMTRKEIFRCAYEAECLVHGTPSGLDPAISTYGGILLFYKDREIIPLKVKMDIPLVVGYTGIQRSTGELVAKVRELRKRHPLIFNPIIKTGGKVVLKAIRALKEEDLKTLGELMNTNHALLSTIGVSSEQLDRLVYAARKAGAFGSKLTGAGGGGSMIALSPPRRMNEVASAIRCEDGTAFFAKKSEEGVRIED